MGGPTNKHFQPILGPGLARTRFFGRDAVSLLLILPIALPGIITGIALRTAYHTMEIPFSFWTIVIGHATFCVVVVYNNAVARLRRTSPSLIEASMDLGADSFQTIRYVILPQALRIAVAPTVGFSVQVVKGTAVTSIIGFTELTKTGGMLANATFEPFMVYGLVALGYFLLCYPLSLSARYLERRLHASA
mgnify:CR=1 FL=1